MQHRKLGRGAKIGLGCGGAGCLGIVLLFVIGIIGVIIGGTEESTVTAESDVQSTRATTSATPTVPAASSVPATPSAPVTKEAEAGTALAMLATLPVKGKAPKTGYDADFFRWRVDTDHNGCDTRNDVLRRDLTNITLKRGTNGCIVLKGGLDDPYAGEAYDFTRTPTNVDIDHVVARSNAWQTGAQKFSETELEDFGNDPLNLLAVSSSLNRQKGDGDAATWLPPNKSFRCEYVARQIAVKHKYGLWVVKAEKAAMERVLAKCDGYKAFTKDVSWPDAGEGDNVKVESAPKKTKKAPSTKPSPKKPSSSDKGSNGKGSGGSVYYKNCTAVREAGAAPIHRGDPGYASHLDRDGDGVGCE